MAYPCIGGGFQHEPFLSIRKVDFGVKDAYKITVFLCMHQSRHDVPRHLARKKRALDLGYLRSLLLWWKSRSRGSFGPNVHLTYVEVSDNHGQR